MEVRERVVNMDVPGHAVDRCGSSLVVRYTVGLCWRRIMLGISSAHGRDRISRDLPGVTPNLARSRPMRGDPVLLRSSLSSLTLGLTTARTRSACRAVDLVLARSGVDGTASVSSVGSFLLLVRSRLGIGMPDGERTEAGGRGNSAALRAGLSWTFSLTGFGVSATGAILSLRDGVNAPVALSVACAALPFGEGERDGEVVARALMSPWWSISDGGGAGRRLGARSSMLVTVDAKLVVEPDRAS